MSAVDAARAVIAWAFHEEGPIPSWHPEALVHAPRLTDLAAPPGELHREACALGAARAAALGWPAPPLGDSTPPGSGAVLLAAGAAFAGVHPFALAIIDACPPPKGTWDLILRDAVVAPAMRASLHAQVAEALLARSPLTMMLDRPAPGRGDAAYSLAERLRRQRDGHRTIVAAFSVPGASLPARRFRAEAMDRLRSKGEMGRDLVLDVYEAILVHHRERAFAEIAGARAVLARDQRIEALDDALTTAAFWSPLSAIRRSHPEDVRRRPYLDVMGIVEAGRFVDLALRLTGGSLALPAGGAP
jgi:hypothetical protein